MGGDRTHSIVREGGLPGRAAAERRPDGTEHRTGIWIGTRKAHRGRLVPAQPAALTASGVDRART
ncbi:hypothetical protein [Streptomyces sp. DSM 40907]|uniref:hypothetical protein n=1 Tax=Streptomyces kutzneri TaxID=3051179 RepID=UPI0028D54E98|nr:hypothetical protein [Streptomyces sp. DSM 40907]